MTKRMNYILWTIQVLLALLFIFAGVVKLTMTAAELAAQIPLPGIFIHVVSVLEILGALGLVLPSIFKSNLILTPLAALGLAIIMVGATVVTIATMGLLPAIMPFVVGILCVCVAYKRWSITS